MSTPAIVGAELEAMVLRKLTVVLVDNKKCDSI